MADASLGTAVLRTRLDQTGLASSLSTLRRETDRTLGGIERRLEATGRRLRGIGTSLTIGVTTPLTILGGAAIKAASDAEETRSKFRTVFRDIGDDAQTAADRLSDAFGQSDRAAQGLLANTGDLLTGFGFSQKAALDLSQQVNELAIDLASFTNFSGGAEGASQALTSALLGEREAAKSLGIAITEDVVQAKIDELRATGDLIGQTEKQQEAYATLLIAQEQSANAIGDFARTQDSFANQTRILSSNLDDLRVALGEGLLPLITPVVSGLADIAAGFADMSEGARNAVLIIGGGAAAAGPLLLGVGQLVTLLPKLRTGLIAVRTVMSTMFGPAGIVAAGAIAFGTLAARTLQATNALNEYANQGIQVQGLTEEAAGLMQAALALEAARGEFVERQRNRADAGEITGEEAQAAIDRYDARIQNLRDRFGEAVREAAALREETASLADIDLGNLDLGLGSLDLSGDRTVSDVFDDLTEAGTRAESRAAAFGNTLEARLTSVETRAGLVSNAIDELFELGLDSADAKVQFLVARLEELERQARILRSGTPTPDAGRLQGGGTPGPRIFPSADRFPQRLARSGDGGLAQLVQIANVNELRTALAGQQINRPTLRESREALGTLGLAEVLRTLNLPGFEGDTDQAVSEGELIARQAELSFDEYLAAMPDAATDLSLSAEELTRAAARLDLDRRTSGVLSVLGRAQADAIRTGRRPGQLGPFTADFGEPDPGFTGTPFEDRGAEGVAPIFDPEVFTREFIAAGERFRQEAVEGGVQTAKELIGAGDRFVGAIGAFAQGNIGGGVSGLGQTAGGILNAIPGLGLVGGLVGAGTGLLGGIINLFGGGSDRGDAQADSARRARNLSTLEINFRLDQQNTFNGGIADPATEQALNRQADAMFSRVEDLIRRAILPDIRALKERTGLA